MRVRTLHSWDVDYAAARRLQEELAAQVELRPLPQDVHLVAGADLAFSRGLGRFFAAVVVLTFPGLEPVELVTADAAPTVPYIPGLLSFREGPVVIEAVRKLTRRPDVFLFDGQGYAHPRRCGLASHMGLWLGVPTVGCAKSRLIGEHARARPRARRPRPPDRRRRADRCGPAHAGERQAALHQPRPPIRLREQRRFRPALLHALPPARADAPGPYRGGPGEEGVHCGLAGKRPRRAGARVGARAGRRRGARAEAFASPRARAPAPARRCRLDVAPLLRLFLHLPHLLVEFVGAGVQVGKGGRVEGEGVLVRRLAHHGA